VKEDKILSGLEESFDMLDNKFDRLELAIIGLYILNVSIVAAAIFLGVFSNG
tara:strand:+ start:129 stop:284 length:156 start_codon:yes stop_codon:yes gene_type:complete